jgi:hypothetical protein
MSQYNVTIDLPYEDLSSGNFMDAGIHENVEMVKVEYGKTPNNEFIAFYFVGPKGEKLSHTEWKPKATANNTPEQLAEKELNQMSRIKKIALNFLTKNEFVFSAHTFEAFANKVVNLLGDTFVGVKLRIKVVYSGKYTSLPNYWKFPFIERMDTIPADKSKIKILTGIDKMVREPDKTPTTTNPFEAVGNGPVAENNLPF